MPAKKSRKVFRPYRNEDATIAAIVRSDANLLEHYLDQFSYHQEQVRDVPITIRAYQHLTIRCTKTGKPFHRRTMQEWNTLCKIHGKGRAEQILEINKFQAVCPEWLFTDDKALLGLAKYDPHGYFVYAATNILLPAQDSILRSKSLEIVRKREFREMLLQEKSALWDNLQGCDVAEIIEANDTMRKYLTSFRTAKVSHLLPFKCSHIPPSILGTEKKTLREWIEEIQLAITALLKHEIKRRKLKARLTAGDIAELHIHYEGHSNFRRQKSRTTQAEILEDELNKFLPQDFQEYVDRRENTYGLVDQRHEMEKKRQKMLVVVKPKKGLKIKFAGVSKNTASDSEQPLSAPTSPHPNLNSNSQEN